VVERAAAERKHAVAEVRSAVPLDARRRDKLAKALSKNLGLDVEVKVIVDPSVIGGAAVRVGDTVIDGTVRHRLDQLKEGL
jgi:F-type H+-transporting ATPase subunit delta